MSGRLGWIGAGAAVVAAFVVIGLLAGAFAPAPQGPPLSSLATTPAGVAGWAALLQRAGHPVTQLRTPIANADISPRTTLVVLAPAPLTGAETRRLARFVGSGGRLVLGGPGGRASAAAIGPSAGGALTVVSPATSPQTLQRRNGLELAGTLPVQNRALATGGNAEFSLRLAGAPQRPVAFAEALHGFGPATGLAAFPRRWWVAIILLAIAALAFVMARGRRVGGPDPLPAMTLPPRTAYLEAMEATLNRTAERARLDELVRARQSHRPEGGSA